MKEYAISIPEGMDTTVLLSDEDAKRAGLLSDTGVKAAPADPANPANQPDAKAAAAPANKAGTPENKSA
jgi:hypothetical protein